MHPAPDDTATPTGETETQDPGAAVTQLVVCAFGAGLVCGTVAALVVALLTTR